MCSSSIALVSLSSGPDLTDEVEIAWVCFNTNAIHVHIQKRVSGRCTPAVTLTELHIGLKLLARDSQIIAKKEEIIIMCSPLGDFFFKITSSTYNSSEVDPFLFLD